MLSDMKDFFNRFSAVRGTKATRYDKFFKDFGAISSNKIRNVERFFIEFDPLAQRLRSYRKTWAPRFNIFKALDIHEDEVLASKFLSYLLDPRGHHDQGAGFLRSFVAFVLGEDKPEDIAVRAHVIAERSAGSYGRLDIAIDFPDGQIIIVENKINASERPKQIEDYQEWLDLQGGQGHAIIFLTPDGRESITMKVDGVRVIALSYVKLIDWLAAVPVPGNLSVLIRQFCHNFNTH